MDTDPRGYKTDQQFICVYLRSSVVIICVGVCSKKELRRFQLVKAAQSFYPTENAEAISGDWQFHMYTQELPDLYPGARLAVSPFARSADGARFHELLALSLQKTRCL